MSVAYELFPCEYPEDVPDWRRVRRLALRPGREAAPQLASVTVLHAPEESEFANPVRLTRRGQVVVALVVAALGAAFVWLASGSAPAAPVSQNVPASVTVESGDTLWSIASRVAPQSDPMSVVQLLQQRNHLVGARVVPGQVLRVR